MNLVQLISLSGLAYLVGSMKEAKSKGYARCIQAKRG